MHLNRHVYTIFKTGNISRQYHIIYDDKFTTFNATNNAEKIIVVRLKKSQPDEGILNQLDITRNTFTLENSPQLTLLDVSRQDTPYGKPSQVGLQRMFLNPRVIRSEYREQISRSVQNNNKLIYVIKFSSSKINKIDYIIDSGCTSGDMTQAEGADDTGVL